MEDDDDLKWLNTQQFNEVALSNKETYKKVINIINRTNINNNKITWCYRYKNKKWLVPWDCCY